MLFCCEKLRPGFELWSRYKLFAILVPFFFLSSLHQSFVCVNNTHATLRNKEKGARMANLRSKCHFLAFLRFSDCTVYRTVMHRHDGPQIPEWQPDIVIYGVHRQTVFWQTVLSHRHCTASIQIPWDNPWHKNSVYEFIRHVVSKSYTLCPLLCKLIFNFAVTGLPVFAQVLPLLCTLHPVV